MRSLALLVSLLCLGCEPSPGVSSSAGPLLSQERETKEPPHPPSTASVAIGPEATSPACPTGYVCEGEDSRAPVDLILVEKAAHRLHLASKNRIVGTYSVALGSGGLGQKGYEGDRTTPHGRYSVTHVIRGTRWHTYLALDYPNEEDKKRYEKRLAAKEVPKVGPGSGIAIHGRRADMLDKLHKLLDWTLGCVALDNDEIDAVAARVTKGIAVEIRP